MSLSLVYTFPIPRRTDHRGSVSFVEVGEHIPFDIKRCYYLYDVTAGESRGAHAHKALQQVFICLAGSFEIEFDDGRQKKTFRLDRPDQGLYVPPGLWRDLTNFSEGAVCFVLASMHFSEEDYIRDYDEFRQTYGD
ncbi:sugar 3,4-ketoisomerase [Deinococcus maricopensis]|uniref:WxcM-like domain-containing protein n=1 Tax=Deinococcus maricopensis (strain DSM 21211 / LMG 22137 / NRRL B-23946 / LB-34) TaxID=709986 RepID=E8U3I0_DEIML|nr:FdtA/QdtA family cupin domain-containing protein [Deinococcus maricopensis]ADV68604.1 WxcM-like domain-containing protein [Deinococcus maricopensis DSM 21211]